MEGRGQGLIRSTVLFRDTTWRTKKDHRPPSRYSMSDGARVPSEYKLQA